ncbi:hypothetical protein MTO96_042854 [Rhipicephalus appendiculatus]
MRLSVFLWCSNQAKWTCTGRVICNLLGTLGTRYTRQCRQRVPQSLKRCPMETDMEELFQEACSWDVSHRTSACTSINAMAAFCTHHGYWVDNLHCDHCLNSPEAQGQKSFRVKSGPLLEVVVLLPESSFDPQVATSVLVGTQKLINAVDASFKARGHDSKYAICAQWWRQQSPLPEPSPAYYSQGCLCVTH